ncbi:MAG: hypothetical protein R3202_12380, partial [Candidatus Competibacterales bacterium]|nr:hypothetical protein [Candidatus Competibacterales bacterium]
PDRGTAQRTEQALQNADGTLEFTGSTAPIGHYGRYYEILRDALRGAGPPPVGPAEACALIHALERAEASSRLGRTLDWGYPAA